MFPIAIKGIPIATILRIISILLIGFCSLFNYNNWDEVFIRNVHIVAFISVLYTVIIYADDIKNEDSFSFYFFAFVVAMSNIFVIANIRQSSESMSREEVIMSVDILNLLLLSFSLVYIKDKYFYSNYLFYSGIPKNEDRIFALTKALVYGKETLYDFEMSAIITRLSELYKESGYTIMSNRAEKFESVYNQYNILFKSVTSRYLQNSFYSEFNDVSDLVGYADYVQRTREDVG